MSDTTPKKHKRSSKKTSSASSSSPSRGIVLSGNKKKPNYYTPFTFEAERLMFGKPQEMKGVSADKKPYTYYDIDLLYRYPNGSVGKPCCMFGDYLPITNIIFRDVPKEANFPVAGSETEKIKFSYISKTAVACLEYDTTQSDMVRRSDYDSEFDGDDMISMGDLAKLVIDDKRGYFVRFSQRVATAIKDAIPQYSDTEETIIASYGKTSNPQHPKMGKNDKTPNKSRPKQSYFDLKGYSYFSDKADPNSLKHVRGSIKLVTGLEYDWDKDGLDKKILRGDMYVETKTLRVKDSNGWKLISSVDPIIVTSQREKENESTNRANDSMARYQNNKEVQEKANAIEKQLLVDRLKRSTLADKKSSSESSTLPNESTSSLTVEKSVKIIAPAGDDSDGEDDIPDDDDDIMSIIHQKG